jgi:uncharacterized protein YcsI (UPF0317 family)
VITLKSPKATQAKEKMTYLSGNMTQMSGHELIAILRHLSFGSCSSAEATAIPPVWKAGTTPSVEMEVEEMVFNLRPAHMS